LRASQLRHAAIAASILCGLSARSL
jgi:hypothetical protein